MPLATLVRVLAVSKAIGVARILSGAALFFPPKSWRPFFSFFCSSPSKDGLKLLNQPLQISKNVLKLTLVLPGCTWCAGSALTNFPCKLRLNLFSPTWGRRCTHCTPGYAHEQSRPTAARWAVGWCFWSPCGQAAVGSQPLYPSCLLGEGLQLRQNSGSSSPPFLFVSENCVFWCTFGHCF